MNLSKLTAKPQLIQITLDDSDIVEKYQEPLTFYTWDRQPMDVFMKLANIEQNKVGNIIDIVKNLILDENGQPILVNDNMLPTNILMRAIAKVTELLGK